MITPAKLVQLIRKHGHEACVNTDKHTLHVAHWVDITPDLGYRREYTDLPATLPAVLAWLGY